MLRKLLIVLIPVICISFKGDVSFKKQQLKYPNVRTAYNEKWGIVKSKLTKAGVDTSHFEVFIRIFKKEAQLEMWAKSYGTQQFKLVDKYDICRSSGDLGPKRMEGDYQVPEGFYYVKIFQPNSAYYLALGVSYPNKSDLIKGNKERPGGDIMIHGNCVTIGCMPLTDDKIKEVYIMAIEAHNNGQQSVPIHIFPTHLDAKGMTWLKNNYKDESLIDFWNNLEPGYTCFETKKTLPSISINDKGDYIFR